jgi:hypothetical protein
LYRNEEIEALILDDMKQLVAPGGLIGLAAEDDAARREVEDRLRKQKAQRERRLATVNETLKGLARKRAEGEFSREEYEALKADYAKEKTELEENLAVAEKPATGPDYRTLAEMVFQIGEQWPHMTVGQKKQVLLSFCEAWGHDIYVHGTIDTPRIEFRHR